MEAQLVCTCKNLAASFVNAFVNAGFCKDPQTPCVQTQLLRRLLFGSLRCKACSWVFEMQSLLFSPVPALLTSHIQSLPPLLHARGELHGLLGRRGSWDCCSTTISACGVAIVDLVGGGLWQMAIHKSVNSGWNKLAFPRPPWISFGSWKRWYRYCP